MKRGYARVSTSDQKLDLQVNALQQAGCDEIYIDKGLSGASHDRPELARLMADAEAGDHVIVWKLDRLGRSLQHLVQVVNDLREKGIAFTSLTNNIDTSTSEGRFFFNIMASLAEFEREIISERTRAGLQAAKARGATLGRPKKLSPELIEHAQKLKGEGMPKRQIARLLKVSPATLYRHADMVD